MRFLFAFLATFALWSATAQAQPAQICAANLAQFPQACPCIIARAQAQGINGPVLDALLANQTANLPIGTFQAYGAIFTQCITDVVTGQVTPAPAPAPAPAAPIPEVPVPQIVPPQIAAPASPPIAQSPTALRVMGGQAPGTWGLMGLDFFGGGLAMPGTHDARGGINVVDLANIDTCAFIATDDIGNVLNDHKFEVLGRLDGSEQRGCNLLYTDVN